MPSLISPACFFSYQNAAASDYRIYQSNQQAMLQKMIFQGG